MHGGARQVGLGQAEDLEKAVAVQRRLTPGETDFWGVLGNERNQRLNLVEQPAVVGALGRLRAHQAVVVALLGHQQAVVRRARAEQHANLLPVGGEPHDIVVAKVVVRAGQAAVGGVNRQVPDAVSLVLRHEVMAVAAGDDLVTDQVSAFALELLGELWGGAEFQQQRRGGLCDGLDGDEGTAEFQHELTHSMKIFRAAGSRRMSAIRCLKMLMLRWQKADSGLRPSTSRLVAWWNTGSAPQKGS
ncbi:hypothetical protein FQZ97_737530 [compost metagenome]